MRGGTRTLGSFILVALTLGGTASAADLRTPPRAAPAPVLYNWTGCYIGGYVGGAWNDRDATFTDQGNATFRSYSGGIVGGRLENPHSWNVGLDSSVIGGGTLGCNYQPAGSAFVFGIEGEVGYMKLEGSAFDPLRSPTRVAVRPDVLGSAKIGDWYGMITGRLGYAWGPAMIYVKGGAAFLRAEASIADACNTTAIGCGNWLVATTDSSSFATGTLGGGLEWAFAGNWSVKAEYMFIGLGDSHVVTTCGVAATPAGTPVAGGAFCFNHDFGGIHTAKVGLNYRFGSSAW